MCPITRQILKELKQIEKEMEQGFLFISMHQTDEECPEAFERIKELEKREQQLLYTLETI